jgi:hypothetical protein
MKKRALLLLLLSLLVVMALFAWKGRQDESTNFRRPPDTVYRREVSANPLPQDENPSFPANRAADSRDSSFEIKSANDIQRDVRIMNDPFQSSPQELRECLQRHFPLESLLRGDLSENVVNEMRRAFSNFGIVPAASMPADKLSISGLLSCYPLQMFRSDCPSKEREIFCRLVEVFMQLLAQHPEEQMYTVFLGQIFSDHWTGWAGLEGKKTEEISQIWHSSEIYRYLINNHIASSNLLLGRIELMNKK